MSAAKLVGRLETLGTELSSLRERSFPDMITALGQHIESELRRPGHALGEKIISGLIRGRGGVSYPWGKPLLSSLRENLFPAANMTSVVFSTRSLIHHAAYLVYDGNTRIAAANALSGTGAMGVDTVILNKDHAVAQPLRCLLDNILQDPSCYENPAALENLAKMLGTHLENNQTLIYRALYHAAILTAGTSRIFGEARLLYPFSDERFPLPCATKTDESVSALWTLDDDHSEAEQSRSRSLPDRPSGYSGLMLWWLIYLFKAALNPNQYTVFWANPAGFDKTRRAGVVVTANVEGIDADGMLDLAAAVNHLASGILSLIDRLDAVAVDRARIKAEEGARKADLAATFSHAYVKQAHSFIGRARQISDAADLSPLKMAAEQLAQEIEVYGRDMEAFSEISKRTVYFKPKSAAGYEDSLLGTRLLRGAALATIVASGQGFFEFYDLGAFDDAIGMSRAILRSTDDGNGKIPEISSDRLVDLWGNFSNSFGTNFQIIFSPDISCMQGVFLIPPEEPKEPGGVMVSQCILFEHVLNKLYFEVFLNAFKHWALAGRKGYPTAPLFFKTKRVIQIYLPATTSKDLRITATSFYPATEAKGDHRDLQKFVDTYGELKPPPSPAARGGSGGWGLFGNHRLAALFRDADSCGQFLVRGYFGEDERDAAVPFSYTWENVIRLPNSYYSILD